MFKSFLIVNTYYTIMKIVFVQFYIFLAEPSSNPARDPRLGLSGCLGGRRCSYHVLPSPFRSVVSSCLRVSLLRRTKDEEKAETKSRSFGRAAGGFFSPSPRDRDAWAKAICPIIGILGPKPLSTAAQTASPKPTLTRSET